MATTKIIPTDDWEGALLKHVQKGGVGSGKEWLFQILELVSEQHQTTSPIHAINSLFEIYLLNVPRIDRMRLISIMNLVAFLTRLNAAFECFDIETDYLNIKGVNEKEVGDE